MEVLGVMRDLSKLGIMSIRVIHEIENVNRYKEIDRLQNVTK
jgi:hypothetical protein